MVLVATVILFVVLMVSTKRGRRFVKGWLEQVPHVNAEPLEVEAGHDETLWNNEKGSSEQSIREEEQLKLEDEVDICYFIQIDGKAIPLIERLITKIWHPRNTYVVHIDWKVDEDDYNHVKSFIEGNEKYQKNFYFVEREAITYKGISMLLNTIAAMTVALEGNSEWQYFINLSGADYPLVSPTTLRKLLARPRVSSDKLNFVTLFPQKEWTQYSFRIKSQYWDPAMMGTRDRDAKTRRMRNMKKWPLAPLRKFVFSKAEAWSMFSRPFVEFIVRSTFAKRMLLAHAHVLSVPEHYFIDVLYNHPYWRKTIVRDAFRKVVWVHAGKRSGQHPYVLDKGKQMFSYWIYLKETRSVFARKFSLPESQLMDRIDNELSGNVQDIDSTEAETEERKRRAKVFYKRLAAHFDSLTKNVLKEQEVRWPDTAYPEISLESEKDAKSQQQEQQQDEAPNKAQQHTLIEVQEDGE